MTIPQIPLCGLLLLLSSCASILSDSNYPVTFNTNPQGGAVTITNESGRMVYEGSTPTTLTLSASDGFFDGETYTIQALREGRVVASTTLSSSMDGWYIGNILFGGIIGLLLVDPATGAMWKLDEQVTLQIGQPAAEASSAP